MVLGLAVLGVSTLAIGLGAANLGGGSPPSSAELPPQAQTAALQQRVADLERERRTRMDEIARLERERAGKAEAVTASAQQLAALQKRRSELEAQIAELAAPLEPPADESVASMDAAPDETVSPPEAVTMIPLPTPAPPRPQPAPRGITADGTEVAAREERDAESKRSSRSEADAWSDADAGFAAGEGVDAGAVRPVRVFIHVRAGDAAGQRRALAVAEELRRQGVEVAGIRGVPRSVRSDAVRFYYDADIASVPGLQQAIRDASEMWGVRPVTAQDFRNRRVAPRPGTIELWLS